MPPRPANRLLVIGWDAADWQVIDPLVSSGKMPNLARLVEAGARADLRTLEPRLSPLLWTTIATGQAADRHRILNFVEPNPSGEGVRVISSTTRRARALWNVLTLRGLRVHVVGWYASHPAEPISGVCVSNLFMEGAPEAHGARWPLPPGAVHGSPEAVARISDARVPPAAVDRATLRGFVPSIDRAASDDPRVRTLAKELSRMRSIHGAALEAIRSTPWDCAMVFHDTIDTIGHHFMGLRPPRMANARPADVRTWGEVIDRTYIEHDRMLGELVDAAGPGTSVMLLSDHGFHSGEDRPQVASTVEPGTDANLEVRWHRSHGVLLLSGPGFKPGARLPSPTLMDIAPTVLAALGLPRARDMSGRVITEAFEGPVSADTVESWDSEPGDAGEHPPELRQDPFEAADALQQLVDLGYMADTGGDKKWIVDLTRRETRFNEAVVLMTTGRAAAAAPMLCALVQERPDLPRYRSMLTYAYLGAGEHEAALRSTEAWRSLEPGSTEASAIRVPALRALGRTADASAELDALESTHGAAPEHARMLSDLAARIGRWRESRDHAIRAIAHNAASPEVHLAAARAALELGDYEASAEHCLDAAERSMAIPEVHFTLGVALAWGGELESAARSLDIALTMDPSFREAAEFAAAVAEARGDGAAAAEFRRREHPASPRDRERDRPSSRDAAAWEAARRGHSPHVGGDGDGHGTPKPGGAA